MSNVIITLNKSGVRELLRSEEMKKVCEEHAEAALLRLGPGYEVTTRTGKNRVNAQVAAISFKAKRDNLKNNTILKALR